MPKVVFPLDLLGHSYSTKQLGMDLSDLGLNRGKKLDLLLKYCATIRQVMCFYQGSLMIVYIFSFLYAKIEQVCALYVYSWPALQFMHMLFRICSLFLWTFLVTHCVVSGNLLKFKDNNVRLTHLMFGILFKTTTLISFYYPRCIIT